MARTLPDQVAETYPMELLQQKILMISKVLEKDKTTELLSSFVRLEKGVAGFMNKAYPSKKGALSSVEPFRFWLAKHFGVRGLAKDKDKQTKFQKKEIESISNSIKELIQASSNLANNSAYDYLVEEIPFKTHMNIQNEKFQVKVQEFMKLWFSKNMPIPQDIIKPSPEEERYEKLIIGWETQRLMPNGIETIKKFLQEESFLQKKNFYTPEIRRGIKAKVEELCTENLEGKDLNQKRNFDMLKSEHVKREYVKKEEPEQTFSSEVFIKEEVKQEQIKQEQIKQEQFTPMTQLEKYLGGALALDNKGKKYNSKKYKIDETQYEDLVLLPKWIKYVSRDDELLEKPVEEEILSNEKSSKAFLRAGIQQIPSDKLFSQASEANYKHNLYEGFFKRKNADDNKEENKSRPSYPFS